MIHRGMWSCHSRRAASRETAVLRERARGRSVISAASGCCMPLSLIFLTGGDNREIEQSIAAMSQKLTRYCAALHRSLNSALRFLHSIVTELSQRMRALRESKHAPANSPDVEALTHLPEINCGQ